MPNQVACFPGNGGDLPGHVCHPLIHGPGWAYQGRGPSFIFHHVSDIDTNVTGRSHTSIFVNFSTSTPTTAEVTKCNVCHFLWVGGWKKWSGRCAGRGDVLKNLLETTPWCAWWEGVKMPPPSRLPLPPIVVFGFNQKQPWSWAHGFETLNNLDVVLEAKPISKTASISHGGSQNAPEVV